MSTYHTPRYPDLFDDAARARRDAAGFWATFESTTGQIVAIQPSGVDGNYAIVGWRTVVSGPRRPSAPPPRRQEVA